MREGRLDRMSLHAALFDEEGQFGMATLRWASADPRREERLLEMARAWRAEAERLGWGDPEGIDCPPKVGAEGEEAGAYLALGRSGASRRRERLLEIGAALERFGRERALPGARAHLIGNGPLRAEFPALGPGGREEEWARAEAAWRAREEERALERSTPAPTAKGERPGGM